MGPLAYGEDDGEVFLGHSVTQHKNMSDTTINAIDEEIRRIIDETYSTAETILRENEDKLHLMADALLKYETIDTSQIDEIMEGKIPGPPKDWTDNAQPPASGGDGGEAVESKDESADSSKPIGGPAGQH